MKIQALALLTILIGASFVPNVVGLKNQSSQVSAPRSSSEGAKTPVESASGTESSRAYVRSDHHISGLGRSARGMASVFSSLDPLGILKSASQIVRKGVHVFRESLHEGVKVAQMLKQDMNEGVTHIWGQKDANKDEPDEVDENKEPTEDSAFEAHSFKQRHSDSQLLREGMLGGILRFMSVDSSRLGIIALNVLIFVAEMITSSLLGKGNDIPDSRVIKDSLLEWITKGNNKLVDGLLKDATKETLPDSLIESLQEKTGNSTSCVQLLLCKLSPVIWGIQKTVDKKVHGDSKGKESPRGAGAGMANLMDSVLSNVPSRDTFVNYGDKCEKRFPNCRLLKFSKHS
ncbi:unnamed protein product [Allacma fusca]|uniref:Uncharacterized protein n=1 Tax=Allacma fusca TaxID=39272 RepID=A0A8J2P9J9_9HEXA|nr:unnamed protein product [Allacma fusca]